MKKLYINIFTILLSSLMTSLLCASNHTTSISAYPAIVAIATLLDPAVTTAIEVATATEFSSAQSARITIADRNLNQFTPLSCKFNIPNDQISINDSIEISRLYPPNSLSEHDAQEFVQNSLHAAGTVYEVVKKTEKQKADAIIYNAIMQKNQALSNLKNAKEELDLAKKECAALQQRLSMPIENKKFLNDASRWTAIPETTTVTLTSKLPFSTLKTQVQFDRNNTTLHDKEIITNRLNHQLRSQISPIVEKYQVENHALKDQQNSLREKLNDFNRKFNADANRLEQTVTTKIDAQKAHVNNLRAQVALAQQSKKKAVDAKLENNRLQLLNNRIIVGIGISVVIASTYYCMPR